MKLLRQALKALLTAGLPPERWLVRGPRGRLADSPTISLTFDDGPHPEHTPRVLDELQRWGLTATFFIIGREAERFPQLVARMVAEGHALGNHTFTHTEPRETTAEQFLDEVRQADQLVSSWTAQPCRWMRPPKGELTRPKLQGLWRSGHTVVLWNVDPRDYRMQSLDEAVAWAEGYQPRHGDIVLLHDKLPYAAEMLCVWGRRGLFERWRSASVAEWLERPSSRLPQSSETSEVSKVVSKREGEAPAEPRALQATSAENRLPKSRKTAEVMPSVDEDAVIESVLAR